MLVLASPSSTGSLLFSDYISACWFHRRVRSSPALLEDFQKAIELDQGIVGLAEKLALTLSAGATVALFIELDCFRICDGVVLQDRRCTRNYKPSLRFWVSGIILGVDSS
eukprot:TRINITY_DN25056_c0_g1_i3.p2 TRINITY_DN25056_c0_g1~~TRINITY_DN25056_c0_g1_i3.p2  ORF type:complete len:110 (-),score=14.44 TRINITY_DN25056_c0_g1_i3:196-525(-)